MCPLKHLGYKSAIVNFSDVYAMNGTPRQITVSLGISKRFTVEHIEELFAGIRLACRIYGVDLVGGDTTSSRQGLVISITCIGEAPADKIVSRSGAKDTDLICVSGDLGAPTWASSSLNAKNRLCRPPGLHPSVRRQGVSRRATTQTRSSARHHRRTGQSRNRAHRNDGHQ